MFLSESARQSLTETGTHGQRRYTEADLATLQRVKSLLGQGLTYAEARASLTEPPAPAAPSDTASEPPAPDQSPASETPSAALAIIEQARLAMASMQQTIEAQAAHLADLQAERDRANERAERAEREASELRRALLDQVRQPAPPRPWWMFWRRDE